MSKVFYDHIVVLERVEVVVHKAARSEEEKHELWQIVDSIVHQKVMQIILDLLPNEHHQEFLERFHQAPHEEGLLDYLSEKSKKDIKKAIHEEIKKLEDEILQEILSESSDEQ